MRSYDAARARENWGQSTRHEASKEVGKVDTIALTISVDLSTCILNVNSLENKIELQFHGSISITSIA